MLFINAHVWACATNTSCRVVHLIHRNVMSQMWLAHIVYRCQWNYKPQKKALWDTSSGKKGVVAGIF